MEFQEFFEMCMYRLCVSSPLRFLLYVELCWWSNLCLNLQTARYILLIDTSHKSEAMKIKLRCRFYFVENNSLEFWTFASTFEYMYMNIRVYVLKCSWYLNWRSHFHTKVQTSPKVQIGISIVTQMGVMLSSNICLFVLGDLCLYNKDPSRGVRLS